MEIEKESIDMEECIDLEEDALNLFLHWDLKMEAISVLGECGIKKISILKMMHSHDVDKILEMRHLFRHHLDTWRAANNVSIFPIIRKKLG